ncbi:MAG: AAA family ATPase [Candidatus Hermodarchaeota archaeon]
MQFPLTKATEFFKSTEIKEGVTSLWGDFGVGKTTLSLQIAKTYALTEKKVLYIYTKPNIPFNKFKSVFENNLKDILNNISFMHTTSFDDLFKFIFDLEFLVLDDLKTKEGSYNLIIVDSLTDLYRLELNSEKKSKNFILNYKLNQLLANLVNLKQKYEIELLIVNEISRRTQEGQTFDLESGGKVMHYWVTNSIKIERTDVMNNRKLILHRGHDNKSFELNSILSNRGFE